MLFDSYFGGNAHSKDLGIVKTQPKSDLLTTEPIVHTDEINNMCCQGMSNTWDDTFGISSTSYQSGLHKLWYPGIRDMSTWSKFGAHGEHGDVFLFSNLGAL